MSVTTFKYQAVDRAGTKHHGLTTAPTEADAFRKLQAAGLLPLKLSAARAGFRKRAVRPKQIAEFTFQLAVLVSARIQLSDGLRSIIEQEGDQRFRQILERILQRIEAGDSFSTALADHEETFGSTYVATMRAAEQSGNLAKALDYLAETLDKQEEMRQHVRAAMTYPVVILVVLALAVTFLIGFVVPRFSKIFASRGVELPPLTRMMIGLGDSVQHYWWAWLVGVGVATYLVRTLVRIPGVVRVFDTALHKIPAIRAILVATAVSRFARIFGLSLSSGINLLDALDMAGRASGRSMLIDDVATVAGQVRAGGRISAVMDACHYLPPFARRMIASGDEAAELPRMCAVIAQQYERETAIRTKKLSTIIEPLLVVLVAGVVLLVALSVFLPMWNSLGLLGS